MQYRGLTLDPFQAEAIGHLQRGESVLVSAPTGTGKTIIADWIVEEALRAGKQVIYTAPIKALSNQKYRDYVRMYGEDKVGLVTGDLVIHRDAPCRVMTTEILRNMLLAEESFDNLAAVILDEVHFLDDRERGTCWEEVLIYLPPTVQTVGLSATIANLQDFADWMTSVRGHKVNVVLEEKRAVPLDFFYACRDTGLMDPAAFKKAVARKRGRNEEPHPRDRDRAPRRGRPVRRTRDTHCFHMMEQNGMMPYLYFVFSRKDAELYARSLYEEVERSLLSPEQQERANARLRQAVTELGAALDPELRALYARGIAFHHAGLHVQLKALVEELYEAKLIQVLYCTSTFALGINMPARSVVFDGLMKFNGRNVAPLSTRQFMQKAGRAGRRGMDEVGHVVIRADIDDYAETAPLVEMYRQGKYESVRSSFSLSWNSVVNLLATHDERQIRAIVEKSFLSWHLSRSVEQQLQRADALEQDPGEKKRGNGRDLKEARRLRRRAERDEGRVWEQFQSKVGFLQRIGYLDEKQGFNAGARVLQNLQIAEIFTTELFLAGLLDELDTPTLFGVLCAIVADLPRGAQPNFRPTKEDRELVRKIIGHLGSAVVKGADEHSEVETTFCPDLLPIGRAWAEGKSLNEVLFMVAHVTDLSGDLVSCFRRAKDLAGQLKEVVRDVSELRERYTSMMKLVTRDEVEVVG